MFLDQVNHPGGQNPGLPRPRPRQHQRRPMQMLNRNPLFRIQSLKKLMRRKKIVQNKKCPIK